MIILGYIFIISIGSTLLYFHDGSSPDPLYLPSVFLPTFPSSPTNTVRTTALPPNPKLGRFRPTSPYREVLPPRTHRHDPLTSLRMYRCRPVLRASLASRCVQTIHSWWSGRLGVCGYDTLDCGWCVWDAWMSWGEFQGMAVLRGLR